MELFEKYGLTVAGGLHIYEVDLTKRTWDFECSTPIRFFWNNFVIRDTSWKNLFPKMADLFFEHAPISKEQAVSFVFDWGKQNLFYETNSKSNLMPLSNGLYINCNHTATHSVWAIEDMINLFSLDVSQCRLFIHRPSFAEPAEIKDYFLKRNKSILAQHLREKYDFEDGIIDKIIQNIDYLSEDYLSQNNSNKKKLSKSYDNLFLIDSSDVFYNIKRSFIKAVSAEGNEKNRKLVSLYLDYLSEVYPLFLQDDF